MKSWIKSSIISMQGSLVKLNPPYIIEDTTPSSPVDLRVDLEAAETMLAQAWIEGDVERINQLSDLVLFLRSELNGG